MLISIHIIVLNITRVGDHTHECMLAVFVSYMNHFNECADESLWHTSDTEYSKFSTLYLHIFVCVCVRVSVSQAYS